MDKRLITLGMAATLVVQATFAASAGAAQPARPALPVTPRGVDDPTSALVDTLQSRTSSCERGQSAAQRHSDVDRSFGSAGRLPLHDGRYRPVRGIGDDEGSGYGFFRLRLTFDGGITLDGTDAVQDIKHSPIFKQADYRSGRTQYGDAMQHGVVLGRRVRR